MLLLFVCLLLLFICLFPIRQSIRECAKHGFIVVFLLLFLYISIKHHPEIKKKNVFSSMMKILIDRKKNNYWTQTKQTERIGERNNFELFWFPRKYLSRHLYFFWKVFSWKYWNENINRNKVSFPWMNQCKKGEFVWKFAFIAWYKRVLISFCFVVVCVQQFKNKKQSKKKTFTFKFTNHNRKKKPPEKNHNKIGKLCVCVLNLYCKMVATHNTFTNFLFSSSLMLLYGDYINDDFTQ